MAFKTSHTNLPCYSVELQSTFKTVDFAKKCLNAYMLYRNICICDYIYIFYISLFIKYYEILYVYTENYCCVGPMERTKEKALGRYKLWNETIFISSACKKYIYHFN